MANHVYEPLRMKAVDADDLTILSACLQDALVPLSGMTFDAEKGHFYLLANRFCWECHPEMIEEKETHQRVPAGLHFDHVLHVREKGLNRGEPEAFMNLLTVHNPKHECISLVFSGGAEIELQIEKLACRLHDLDDPHPTHHKPSHPLE